MHKSPPQSILSEQARRLRLELSEKLGISQTVVLELAIRGLAKREGLK